MLRFSFHATVQGSSHIQNDVPCEDASGSIEIPEVGGYAFAVADGHGDPACVRSEYGSRMAVDLALVAMRAYALEYRDQLVRSRDEDTCNRIAQELARNIVTEWRKEVLADYDEYPLVQETWDAMDETAQSLSRARPEHLYGTTLVAGLVLPNIILFIQQGDGSCVVLDANGEASFPMPEDKKCIGNVTTSLCDTHAQDDIRAVVVDTTALELSACFVCTDGVDKSLLGSEGLADFYTEVALDALGSSSPLAMHQVLSPSLQVLSEHGSGDDASVAGFVDIDTVAANASVLVSRHERFIIENERRQIVNRMNSMERMRARYESTVVTDEDESEARDRFFDDYKNLRARVVELDSQLSKNADAKRGKTKAPMDPLASKEREATRVGEESPVAEESAEQSISSSAHRGHPIARNSSMRQNSTRSHIAKRGGIVAGLVLVIACVIGIGFFAVPMFTQPDQVASSSEGASSTESTKNNTDTHDAGEESSLRHSPALSSETVESILSDELEDYKMNPSSLLDKDLLAIQENHDLNRTKYERCFGRAHLLSVDKTDVSQLDDVALVRVRFTCGRCENEGSLSDANEIAQGSCVTCLRIKQGNRHGDNSASWSVADDELKSSLLEVSGYAEYLQRANRGADGYNQIVDELAGDVV